MNFHKAGKKPAKKAKSHGAAKKATKRRAKHNPAPSRRFHSKRRIRKNPGLDLKSFGVSVAGVGAGALGAVYINNLAARWLPVRFRGFASIAAGAAVVMFAGRNEHAERAALGAAGMGFLDLLRSNVPALAAMGAEDAGYLLGAAAAQDSDLAAMLGVDNANVPDVLGVDNANVPDVLGFDTGSVALGFDTGSVALGDEEGDGLFEDDDIDL
jgi:hypothetical protein